MHLDFLPVCFHADISTQASTSANSLMGPVSSLLDCSLPALHKSVQISSRAGIYCLIHYETQQRGQAQKGFTEKPVLPPLQNPVQIYLGDYGTGKLAELLPVPLTCSSKSELLL